MTPTHAGFLILEGRDAGKIISIEKFPFEIGRQIESDLVLTDEEISRRHARIEESPQGPVLIDLGSRNGLYVNDVRVTRHRLSVGDRIKLGATILIFQPDASKARQWMTDSIPDSEAFATSEDEPTAVGLKSLESNTAVRFVASPVASPEGSDPLAIARALSQASRLFLTSLPPEGVASQLLDLLFQSFVPDRAAILLTGAKPVEFIRSRKEGKNAKKFEISKEWMTKAKQGAVLLKQERSILISPILVSGQTLGWMYMDRTAEQSAYSASEKEGLQSLSLIGGGAIERSFLLSESRGLREQIRKMEMHVSPEVARMISARSISLEESSLSVEDREVTVLFCDIVGFTPLSERMTPAEIAQLLNEYFQRMVDVIQEHQGHLNKFIGDAIMAIFGAPEQHGNDATHAVAAGLGMLEALKKFWKQIDEKKRFSIRIGINTGHVVVGNIGSEKKMEYTVLGDAVNVASRIEGISPPNTVTLGARTAELVSTSFELKKVTGVKVKGKAQEMEVFHVVGASPLKKK